MSQGKPQDHIIAQESTDELTARLQALSPAAHTALRQHAKAHLTAAGVAPWLQIGPVIEATMCELLTRSPG